MVNAEVVFGGIEGGATQSTVALLDGDGKVLVTLEGPSTNHWLSGMEECQNRINDLVNKAKETVGIAPTTTLQGLGLCLSGCEDEESNGELSGGLQRRFPGLSESVFVASDTVGSLSTGCDAGVILISGTGSNSLLLNPDGTTCQSGGWGHMGGEKGSGYWVANQAIRTIFEEEDNLIDPPHPTEHLRGLIFEHFKIKNRLEILEHWYRKFDKSVHADLTRKISQAGREGDKMCAHLMAEAGFTMGRYLGSHSRRMQKEVLEGEHGLEVICTGSVFKSWDLMKPGFVRGVKPHCKKDKEIPKITLFTLKVTSAVGAAYQASKKYGYDMPKNYSDNRKAFCVIKSDGTTEDLLVNGDS